MRAIAAMAYGLLLASCGSAKEDPSREDLQREVGYLRYQVAQADKAAADSETAISGLRAAVNRFDREDWRTVVPDVQDATAAVESDQGDMDKALDR